MTRYNKAGHPTSLSVAEAIEAMRDALFREYGTDYAFSILGHGRLLAASTNADGIIHAVIKE